MLKMKLVFIIVSLISLISIDMMTESASIGTCDDQFQCIYIKHGIDTEPGPPDGIPDSICLVAEFTDDEADPLNPILINPQDCKKDPTDPADCISWECVAGTETEDPGFCDGDDQCVAIDCDLEPDEQVAIFYLKDGNNKEDGCGGSTTSAYHLPRVDSTGARIMSIYAFCHDADPDYCDADGASGDECGAKATPNYPCDCKGSCEKACVWIISYAGLCAPCENPCTSFFTVGGGISSLSIGDPFAFQAAPANNNDEISLGDNAFKTDAAGGGGISVNHLVIIIFCIFIVSAVIAGFVYYYVRVIKNRKFMKKVLSNAIINDEAEVAEVAEQQNQMHMECESITNTPTSQNDNTNDNTDS